MREGSSGAGGAEKRKKFGHGKCGRARKDLTWVSLGHPHNTLCFTEEEKRFNSERHERHEGRLWEKTFCGGMNRYGEGDRRKMKRFNHTHYVKQRRKFFLIHHKKSPLSKV